MQNVITEYIEAQDTAIKPQLRLVYTAIHSVLPDAVEKISYGMPTFWKGHNLIHFAAQKKHIGLYPGPEAVEHYKEFLDELELKYSKGAIQIPYDQYIPVELIRSIAEWCLKHNAEA